MCVCVCLFIRLISILFEMVFLRENVLHDIDTNINLMRRSDIGIIIFDLIESTTHFICRERERDCVTKTLTMCRPIR